MIDSLDIAAVVRLTGLSSRALRFYEARGLLRPLRTYSGRRHYGPAELERIHQIVALKQAGFKLAEIAALDGRRAVDFASLIELQLSAIAGQTSRLAELHTLLVSIRQRLHRSESIDTASFCNLIRQSEHLASEADDGWATLVRHYMSAQAEADFLDAGPAMPDNFDHAAYAAQWAELGGRIKQALPLDPASPAAFAFLREWYALLAPFSAIATPAMWAGTRAMYDDVDGWRGQIASDPGFDGEVWQFMTQATDLALARGDDLGPLPPWMQRQSIGNVR